MEVERVYYEIKKNFLKNYVLAGEPRFWEIFLFYSYNLERNAACPLKPFSENTSKSPSILTT